jgi:hypothetical protein
MMRRDEEGRNWGGGKEAASTERETEQRPEDIIHRKHGGGRKK